MKKVYVVGLTVIIVMLVVAGSAFAQLSGAPNEDRIAPTGAAMFPDGSGLFLQSSCDNLGVGTPQFDTYLTWDTSRSLPLPNPVIATTIVTLTTDSVVANASNITLTYYEASNCTGAGTPTLGPVLGTQMLSLTAPGQQFSFGNATMAAYFEAQRLGGGLDACVALQVTACPFGSTQILIVEDPLPGGPVMGAFNPTAVSLVGGSATGGTQGVTVLLAGAVVLLLAIGIVVWNYRRSNPLQA